MKIGVLRKIYIASLSLACVSIILSILLLSVILQNGGSQVVESNPETILLAIKMGQLSLVQFVSAFPSILALLNGGLFVWLYLIEKYRGKSYWFSLNWVVFSILYSIMVYYSAKGVVILDLIYYPVMVLTWVSKVATIRILWQENKQKKGE